jgi:uncharacterized protein with HEPN domain
MQRDYKLYLEDILAAGKKVSEYTDNVTFEQFVAEDMRRAAVTHYLMLMGEAAKSIPVEMREAYPYVDWKIIIRLRNVIAHEYFALTPEQIWNFVQDELAKVHAQVQQMFDEE